MALQRREEAAAAQRARLQEARAALDRVGQEAEEAAQREREKSVGSIEGGRIDRARERERDWEMEYLQS